MRDLLRILLLCYGFDGEARANEMVVFDPRAMFPGSGYLHARHGMSHGSY
jgi:hypothetical protein